MAEQVVVAVDGGDASAAAVRWVAARAAQRELAVDVMTVIPMDEPGRQRPHHERALIAAREVLWATPARRSLVEQTRHGDPVEELLAASREADLLVVGTRRTSGLASLLHLTIPLQLAGKTGCPLVVVPAGWRSVEGPIVAGWEDDGSSDAAVALAALEAEAAGAELHLVRSWRLPAVEALDPQGSAEVYTNVQRDQNDLLEHQVQRVRAEYPSVHIHSELTPDTAQVALERLGDEAALVVVGSHGRGAVADLLLGSVADDLIRSMTCPVMIAPARHRVVATS